MQNVKGAGISNLPQNLTKNQQKDDDAVILEQAPKKSPQDKEAFAEAVAAIKLSDININHNEMFVGELVGIVERNRDKNKSMFRSVLSFADGEIRNLYEKIKFDDGNGGTMGASVDDLVTNGRFRNLSAEAQANFIKAFQEHPEKIKTPGRKTFDKLKSRFLKVFGVAGFGAAGIGLLLAVNTVAPFLGPAAVALTWLLTAFSVIGLSVGIAVLAKRIKTSRANREQAKKNQTVVDKVKSMQRNISLEKEKAKESIGKVAKAADLAVKTEVQKGNVYNMDEAFANAGEEAQKAEDAWRSAGQKPAIKQDALQPQKKLGQQQAGLQAWQGLAAGQSQTSPLSSGQALQNLQRSMAAHNGSSGVLMAQNSQKRGATMSSGGPLNGASRQSSYLGANKGRPEASFREKERRRQVAGALSMGLREALTKDVRSNAGAKYLEKSGSIDKSLVDEIGRL